MEIQDVVIFYFMVQELIGYVRLRWARQKYYDADPAEGSNPFAHECCDCKFCDTDSKSVQAGCHLWDCSAMMFLLFGITQQHIYALDIYRSMKR